MTRWNRIFCLAAATVLLAAPTAWSQPASQATPLSSGDALTWNLDAPDARALVLRVSTPDGTVVEQEFDADETVRFTASGDEGTRPDGLYVFEIREYLQPSLEATEALNRDDGMSAIRGSSQIPEGQVWSGVFRIQDGSFFVPREETEPGGAPSGGMTAKPSANMTNTTAEQVISGDLVVYNSICVGFDCPTSPTFGADTIRLQENNLRIHFDDTSTASSFPRTDWRIIANDQANGGLSRFSIQDASASRIPFTLEANAQSNALYVDDGGRVGFGTSTPVLELHVADGDSPGLRLEQDGSSGFAPQTWDIAGNETNFFVRDATNGSLLPFRIFPGSPSSSLVIRNGDVGVGTASPGGKLHVKSGSQEILFANTNGAGIGTASPSQELHVSDQGDANSNTAIRISTANHHWDFSTSENTGNFRISKLGTGTSEFDLTATGNLTIPGEIFTAGDCSSGCDRVFYPEYGLESIEEHANRMWEQRYLPAVGPTDGKGPFNLSQKTLGILNELEKAHIYIEQLNRLLKQKQDRLSELEQAHLDLHQEQLKLDQRLRTLESGDLRE